MISLCGMVWIPAECTMHAWTVINVLGINVWINFQNSDNMHTQFLSHHKLRTIAMAIYAGFDYIDMASKGPLTSQAASCL